MEELKSNVMKVIDTINQDWVSAIKDAEKNNEGIDLSQMMGKFSHNIVNLDKFFLDAKERVPNKKKGFLR